MRPKDVPFAMFCHVAEYTGLRVCNLSLPGGSPMKVIFLKRTGAIVGFRESFQSGLGVVAFLRVWRFNFQRGFKKAYFLAEMYETPDFEMTGSPVETLTHDEKRGIAILERVRFRDAQNSRGAAEFFLDDPLFSLINGIKNTVLELYHQGEIKNLRYWGRFVSEEVRYLG